MPFDCEFPNNDLLLISEERLKFISQDLQIIKYINEANKKLYSLEKAINLIPNPKILLDFISIPESVESNAVENIHTTIDEAFQAEAMNDMSKISKPTKETLHYKEALLYGFRQIQERGGITVNDIKKINSIIVGHESDFYSSPHKKIKTSTGKILYTPPQGIDLIGKLMDNFCVFFNKQELVIDKVNEDILLLAPILHYQFEAIHPFGDGNGRTGRILLVLFLTLHGILSYPVLFLSQYIYEYKDIYYTSLRGMDIGKENSLKSLTEFILVIMQIQGLKTENVILNIHLLQKETELKLKEETDFKRISEIMDYLFMKPYYTVEGLSRYLDIHRNTASTYLSKLVEIGLVVEKKEGRNKLFFFKNYLDVLKDSK